MKNNKSTIEKKLLLEVFLYSFTLLILFLFLFRIIRNLFLVPKINQSKIIGYTHYTGYPFYADTMLFLMLMSIPLLSCAVALLRKKIMDKNI